MEQTFLAKKTHTHTPGGGAKSFLYPKGPPIKDCYYVCQTGIGDASTKRLTVEGKPWKRDRQTGWDATRFKILAELLV